MTVEIRDELVLPRRVTPQPTPNFNGGGDCVACSVAGAVGMPVEQVYEIAKESATSRHPWPAEGHRALDDEDVIQVLWRAKRLGLVERWIESIPIWPWETWPGMARKCTTFGLPGHRQYRGWLDYIRMAQEAGYYALGGVDSARQGPYPGESDHWVMLCGVRQVWEFGDDGCGSGHDEVLISCSSRVTPAEEWVDVGAVLGKRGMFGVLLVRPKAA